MKHLLTRRPFTIEHREHGACRDCDDVQRMAVAEADRQGLTRATAVRELATAKGTVRRHVVTIARVL